MGKYLVNQIDTQQYTDDIVCCCCAHAQNETFADVFDILGENKDRADFAFDPTRLENTGNACTATSSKPGGTYQIRWRSAC